MLNKTSRRIFLRFLGLGMAAATVNPGQLIAAVSRPVQVAMPGFSVLELIDTRMQETTKSMMEHLVQNFFRPNPTWVLLVQAQTISGGRGIQAPLQYEWKPYSANIRVIDMKS